MKIKWIAALAIWALLLLSGCRQAPPATEPYIPTQVPSAPEVTQTQAPETQAAETHAAVPEATEPPVTEPAHASLYIPGVPVEDVITYFSEVCLDSEFVNGGDPSYVQKWTQPIYYTLEGNCTEEDIAVLSAFRDWLNGIEGFPGMFSAGEHQVGNLRICFCTQQEMVDLMGENFEFMDGAVTFWYNHDEIYDAIICYRTEIDQYLRNSVILEEIYNGLGPIQDTVLRPDSIIYQEFSQPQALTALDELILRLLYHPDILPGMDAAQCEQVIRSLYH